GRGRWSRRYCLASGAAATPSTAGTHGTVVDVPCDGCPPGEPAECPPAWCPLRPASTSTYAVSRPSPITHRTSRLRGRDGGDDPAGRIVATRQPMSPRGNASMSLKVCTHPLTWTAAPPG